MVIFLTGSLFYLDAENALSEQPSPEVMTKGRELFNSKEGLAVKYACILCHQKEKVIKKTAVQKLGDKLPEFINNQIVKKAKGKPIPVDSPNMQALAAYIRYEHSK